MTLLLTGGELVGRWPPALDCRRTLLDGVGWIGVGGGCVMLAGRRSLDLAGAGIAFAGGVLVAWWLAAVLADPAHLPEGARFGPVPGLVFIATGAAAALRLGHWDRLVGALAALVFAAFLLVLSTNPLRGLTPAAGDPAVRPEALSLVAGLVLTGAALALVLDSRKPTGER